jgi:hypothetical protein
MLAGLGLVAACAAVAHVNNLVTSAGWFLVLFSAAFLCYALAAWRLATVGTPAALALVIGVGLAARVALAPAVPTLSTDAYRYVWDARVAAAGIDPYAFAPTDPEVEPLRDDTIFPHLNHASWRTIYPPAAQLLFRAVYRVVPDSVAAMKLAVALVELVGAAVLLGLLRAAGRPLSQAVIYWWNPLVLVEIWGTGHLDGVLVPFVVGAMWAALRRRYALAGALLGAAAAVKLYPTGLVAALPGAAWPAAVATWAGVLLVAYAPALSTGTAVLGSLPRYLTEDHFNPGLVRTVVDTPVVTLAAAAGWLVAVAALGRAAGLAARAVLVAGGLVLLSPNVFPWYAVWLVPLLAWAPSWPWIAFTGTVAFAYAFFVEQPWSVPGWARALEIAPLAVGAGWWLAARRAAPGWKPERAA